MAKSISEFEVGDVFKSENDDIITLKIIKISNKHITWKDIDDNFTTEELKESLLRDLKLYNYKELNYLKSPLWKKLEGIQDGDS